MAAAEPTPAPEPEPEMAPPPPPPPEPEMAPAPVDTPEAPAEAPAEEEEGGVPGWFRVDHDSLLMQVWFGASHDLGGVSLATDIYVDSISFAEFDIGVELPIGDSVLLIPMAGIGFDWQERKAVTLIAPQLFGYFDFDPIYIEWWSQFFLNSVFPDPGYVGDSSGTELKDLEANTWYNRLFVLYNATENLSVGPQLEMTIGLNDAGKVADADTGDPKALASLAVGGRVNVGYGENNTLGLFLGYETVQEARGTFQEVDDDGMAVGEPHERPLVGRFTFIRTW
jgi:hypothetical protein